MFGLVKKIALLALLLASAPAFAQTVTIGETDFPLGESAFPSASECLDPSGCGSEDYRLIDFSDPLLRPVAPTVALLGHRLDFTTFDLDEFDIFQLTFPVPIANQQGADVYLGQAEFLADLADAGGLNDVQIRFGSSQIWHTVSQSRFTRDAGVLATVFYQDPEIKSDAYRLWFAKLDLSDFGVAAGETISTVVIRGVINLNGSGLDAAIVGNLNAGSPGNSPPEALDDTASTNEDTSVTVDVLANDADPDGDQLSVDAVTQGQNGAVVNNGTYVTYTPNANFNGFDSFDYTVMDPSGGAAMAIVTVSVTAVNDAPIADPGPDQTVFVTREVTLDGSGSMDVEGDLLSYEWQLIEKPSGSAAVLFDPMAVNPTFIVDLPGTYVAELVVNDGVAASAPGRVTISTANSAPLADAGPDQTAFVGDTVTLDGGGSSDVDGDPLSFAWSLSRVPGGSGATLSDPTSPNPWFIVDQTGNYVAELTVDDGMAVSAPDTVTISTENSAPVAEAGPNQTVFVGTAVTLDGSSSSDVDGDPLTYAWSLTMVPSGSTAVLSGPDTVSAGFEVDLPGVYVAQLIVNDGAASTADTVTISTMNSAPVANAGPDQTVFVASMVTLEGGGSSDVDGDGLSFAWSLVSAPAGSIAALSDPTTVSPTFDVDLPGSYLVQLIVNDGQTDSVPDTVKVSTMNSAPVANAGPDQTVFVGDTVTLDASGSSDVDGDPLAFFWSLASVPVASAATLSEWAAVSPSFGVDLPGTYVAQLIVNDGLADSVADTVTISTENSPPVADAGEDQSVFVGGSVLLDASGSSDVDGDPLSYFWSLSVPGGSLATLSSATARDPFFGVDQPGTYVVQLIVNDGSVDSAPDTVSISTMNSAPVADAGADQKVLVGDSVTLDGGGSSDVDGSTLTFSWALISVPFGSAASLSDPTVVSPSFDVDIPGTYVAQLIVNDGDLDSSADSITIFAEDGTKPPPAPGDTLSVDEVSWRADSGELDVRGKGTAGAEVLVLSASSRQAFSGTLIGQDGKWRVIVALSGPVPCRVRAESSRLFAERDVGNAPQACPFKIKEIEWRASDGELEVKGLGQPGAQVVIHGVESRKLLGATIVDATGDWRLKFAPSGPVPCHVRAESPPWSAESAVKNAPEDCGAAG